MPTKAPPHAAGLLFFSGRLYSTPMSSSLQRTLPIIAIGGILLIHFIAALPHIQDPFIDGRHHQNWNPPFWLLNAEVTNRVGIAKSFFGVAAASEEAPGATPRATSFYASHPQLIGPVTALWTRIFGYGEWSPRLLSLLIVAGAALLSFFSLWTAYSWQFGASFAALLVSLPLIVVYGSMLNHEPLVLFFLAFSLWGFTKIFSRGRGGALIFTAGVMGMALSDWSGFVFGALLSILFFVPPLRDSMPGPKWTVFLVPGAVLAAAGLFLLQTYLQAGMPPLEAFADRYLDLWRYRSGQEATIPWLLWIRKELLFANHTYSLPLFAAGAVGLAGALYYGFRRATPPAQQAVMLFAAAVLIGQVFYLFFLKQATFVHVYYQYFFSVPIAFGTIWLANRLSAVVAQERRRNHLFIGVVFVVIAASSLWSWRVYTNLLRNEMWGDRSDIALVASLSELPAEARVVVADDPTALEWFANPNITYYARRPIERHSLEKVPLAPYQIVPSALAGGLVKLLASGQAYGAPVAAEKLACSTHFCLLKLED